MRIALPVLAGLLVLSPMARAQDACLTGDSTLADQRAFAAFGTATEAACPCADAASGEAYQRCAKKVLATHARGRRRSARSARSRPSRLVRSTSCGATQGALRHRSGRNQRRQRRSELQALAPEVLQGRAARTTARAARTRPRATTSSRGPPAPASIPATRARTRRASRSSPGRRTRPRRRARRARSTPSSGTRRPRGADRSIRTTGGVVDAPLDASGGPYPVVLFSHGSCGYPLQSTFLTPLLASRGYIVVAPPHPGNTINEFPTCGTRERPGRIVHRSARGHESSCSTRSWRRTRIRRRRSSAPSTAAGSR